MLRSLRRSRPLLGPCAAAIAAMVLLGTLNWWHADDDEGYPQAVHDHSAHHFAFHAEKTQAPSGGDHCYLCHWLRTLGSSVQTASPHGPNSGQSQPLTAVESSRTHARSGALLPARAPPS